LRFVNSVTRRGVLGSIVACVSACLLPTAGVAQPKEDLPNFHTVSPGIYRGAAPTPEGLQKLRAMGVRTIIDLRISPKQVKKEKQQAERLGFRWLNLPMGSEPPTTKQVSTLLSTLKLAPQEPVFVHCQHGADRTGCMIGIWRVTQQNWTYDQTYKEMRKYGFKPYYKELASSVRQRVPPVTKNQKNR
jgi:tyrosine-protein phosphatase SIW14